MSIASYPTVEGLQAKRNKLAVLLKAKLSQPKVCPLSFAQQQLWFIHEMAPDSSAYNLPYAVRLMGQLDVDAVRRSINEIVRRHEILRTTFHSGHDKVHQVIAASGKANMQFVDLTTLTKDKQEEAARQLIEKAAIRSYNLSSECLMRVFLLKFAGNDHMLLVTMHHIVGDGWSVSIMMQEFCALYDAYRLGQSSPLKDLPIQYADYTMWQREWLTERVLQQHLEYWRNQLAGASVLEIPTDYPRSSSSRHRAGRIQVSLPLELTERINELCRREGATLFMTMLAGFQLLLNKYTEQTDIAVGSVIANRNRSEVEGLIGFFVNTLVLRTNASGNPTFRELLARVREMTLGAYAHQDLPFEKLVEHLQPERSVAHVPLFQAMFVVQNGPQRDLELQDIRAQHIQTEVGEAKFELTLSLHQSADEVKGELEYAADLFEAATMQRLVEALPVLAGDRSSQTRSSNFRI